MCQSAALPFTICFTTWGELTHLNKTLKQRNRKLRAVIQRVKRAEVRVDELCVGKIERGIVAFVGLGHDDDEADARQLARKICGLRIFSDAADRMNFNVKQAGGSILAVSQFTLYGDARKGMRPSFMGAQEPELARSGFARFCELLREEGVPVAEGRFKADMDVELVNDGPVTILLDSKRVF